MRHWLDCAARRLAVFACIICLVAPVSAQEYPSRQVHFIVPQAAGGGTDTFARAVGQKLSERWGQPVVIENRAGAGGVVGTDFVAKAPADGYTLLVTYEGSQAINQSLYPKLPFDSVKDFQPIATIAVTPFFLVVGPKIQSKTLQDFVALAREKPDTLNYASAGNGSVNHLLGEMLKSEVNIRITHVPYKGASQAITDVIGGHVDAAFASVPSVISQVQSGTVRALAVSSGKRVAITPDVPTIAESGVPNFDVNPWWGILGPAGLSPDIVRKINADMAAILATSDMQALLATHGASPFVSSPEDFSKLLQSDIEKWAKAVKAAGARIN
jgi:tripartite-type tricarboxylate transporter receptor subunit TctC